MHVLLINGSPHKNGSTFTALNIIAEALREEGVDSSFFQLGTKPVFGCIACAQCMITKRCVLTSDHVNELVEAMAQADGIIVGSPVYYAGPNGALCALLDRAFFLKDDLYAHKPAAAIVVCRRGGASSAFDRLNKYFTIANMPVVSSQYWNAVHASQPEDVLKDREGVQIMRVLGKNMAWMLKSLKQAGLQPPVAPEWDRMDFHHA